MVREQRSGMVQTEAQYKFIYLSVSEYIQTRKATDSACLVSNRMKNWPFLVAELQGGRGRFQEKSILMCRSIDLCNLTAVDHFNVNRICYQSSTCERWTLTHRQTDRQKKKICHIDKTSRRTSLRLSHSPAYLTCLCLFFRQETETEYGNLPLKCQPVTKKASKWVGLSLCMSLCVNRTWMHSQGSSTLLTAALLFISWLSQHLQSHVCSCILDRGPAVGGKMHCICI